MLKRNREMGQELDGTGGREGSNRKVLGPLCIPKGVVQQRQRQNLSQREKRWLVAKSWQGKNGRDPEQR